VLVHLDDILVMSRTPKDHLQHLRLVLDLLSKYEIYAKLSKCEFGKTTLKFLGHVVSAGAVAADPDKINALRDWPLPASRARLRSFLGLANFIRRFISHYSEIPAPLTGSPATTSLPVGQPGQLQSIKLSRISNKP
jgi:hypothetical protein